MSSISNTTVFILAPQFGRSQLPIFHRSLPTVRFNLSTVRIQATFTTVDISKTTREGVSADEEIKTSSSTILGCPICYDPLTWSHDSILSLESVRGTTLECSSCKKVYYGNDSHFELTAASGSKDYVESMAPVTEFFRTPAMSFVYERGWRQNFGIGGYPGPEKEFEMAKEYLGPVLGGNIIDASCGSGVFSRLFAKSGLFSLVIALDYSEAMLRQCYEFVKEDQDFPKDKLVLVRADISRLPFVSHSIDAVHAGAALHCWPSPSAAVAEISRVLKPGGVFVATTTLADGPFSVFPFARNFRGLLQQYSGSRIFLSENELKDLCTSCGLVEFSCRRNGPFVMISATKPS